MTFSPKNRKFVLGVRPLDMAPVEQLGDVGGMCSSLPLVCAALWHWYLPLRIYITFLNFVSYPYIPF